MLNSKQLSHDQIETIRKWAAAGARLADIQKRMKEEMNFSPTYMDTRFIVLDLGITLDEEKPVSVSLANEFTAIPTGKTTVTLDSIALPRAIISGNVTFSDGEYAVWMLDQMGRPSLNPSTIGYQPSQEDIMEFQQQLRSIIEQQGF